MQADSRLRRRVKVIRRDNLGLGGCDGDGVKGCISLCLHMNTSQCSQMSWWHCFLSLASFQKVVSASEKMPGLLITLSVISWQWLLTSPACINYYWNNIRSSFSLIKVYGSGISVTTQVRLCCPIKAECNNYVDTETEKNCLKVFKGLQITDMLNALYWRLRDWLPLLSCTQSQCPHC